MAGRAGGPPLSERRNVTTEQRDVAVLDPSDRTLEQMLREISQTREIVEANGRGTREVLETRLSAGDKAIELLQRDTDMLPEQIRNAVEQLRLLHDERFTSLSIQLATHLGGIQTQFTERDKRMEQLSLADKTAIAAALQAQKESYGAQNEANNVANTKMENNFSKLIEQTHTLVQALSHSMDEKIADLKGRFDRGEGRTSASDPAVASALLQLTHDLAVLKTSNDARAGHAVGANSVVGYIIGAGGLIVALAALFLRHT